MSKYLRRYLSERLTLQRSRTEKANCAEKLVSRALVQIAGSAEMILINMDALLIEEDGIPNGGRCGVLEPDSAEVELPLANAMHQLDA